jgi:hypothetical protein
MDVTTKLKGSIYICVCERLNYSGRENQHFNQEIEREKTEYASFFVAEVLNRACDCICASQILYCRCCDLVWYKRPAIVGYVIHYK